MGEHFQPTLSDMNKKCEGVRHPPLCVFMTEDMVLRETSISAFQKGHPHGVIMRTTQDPTLASVVLKVGIKKTECPQKPVPPSGKINRNSTKSVFHFFFFFLEEEFPESVECNGDYPLFLERFSEAVSSAPCEAISAGVVWCGSIAYLIGCAPHKAQLKFLTFLLIGHPESMNTC